MNDLPNLKLLPYREYAGVNRDDPIRFYFWPFLGKLYRRRVELCLAQCSGGERILEVGFGSGVTFLNLHEIYKEIHGLDLSAVVKDVSEVFKTKGIETYLQNGDLLSMPYKDNFFDSVLLISILEHLKPPQQIIAFKEIHRVLKPGGQVIYGVPIQKRFMVWMFTLMGCNISEHHFSTQNDVFNAAEAVMNKVRIVQMQCCPLIFGPVYEVGHFIKNGHEKK